MSGLQWRFLMCMIGAALWGVAQGLRAGWLVSIPLGMVALWHFGRIWRTLRATDDVIDTWDRIKGDDK